MTVLAVPLAVAARRLAADPRQLRTERIQFPTYLLLVGIISALAYALLRGGSMAPSTVRYALLSLLTPVGAIALFAHPDEAVEVRATPCDGCRQVADVWIRAVTPSSVSSSLGRNGRFPW